MWSWHGEQDKKLSIDESKDLVHQLPELRKGIGELKV